MKLETKFKKFCEEKNFEINDNQIEIIRDLNKYYRENLQVHFIKNIFKKNKKKLGFYLVGDVGVGKTMILNFFFKNLKQKKLRLHFNEFMIEFHNFIFKKKNKENGIDDFVKDLNKKTKILYFDEFQVTNIVDAMILGQLFKKIFEKKINVIFTSNIDIENLYEDGLQREQFLPFIEVLKKHSYEKKLLIKEDYRKSKDKNLERFLSPLDQINNFKLNKFFRKLTKNKKKSIKVLYIKGRKLEIKNFYEGIVKFDFEELCNRNLGSEDYIKISENSFFIFIENVPDFNEINSNQQQRFVTLIDIIYEKKIPLMVTSESNLNSFNSSKSLKDIFKRTTSRLHELTFMRYN